MEHSPDCKQNASWVGIRHLKMLPCYFRSPIGTNVAKRVGMISFGLSFNVKILSFLFLLLTNNFVEEIIFLNK